MEKDTKQPHTEVPQGDAPAVSTAPVTSTAPAAVSATATPGAKTDFRSRTGGKDLKKNTRRGGGAGGRREPKARPEYDQRIINIRRVARVVAGGRRFSFSVCLVAGNRKGMVGVGLAKAGDTSLAIEKALREAKKNMIQVRATKHMSIPHDVKAKYASARILIIPAPDRGIIAGSSLRTVIELAGLKDINAKILSPSKNKLNIARAAIKALEMLHKPKVA